MNVLLEISYFVLCAVIVVEWTVLHDLAHKVADIRRKRAEENPEAEKLGERFPRFTAAVLGSSDTVSDRDLLGRTTCLVFVDPATSVVEPTVGLVASIIHRLWHQYDRAICIVCNGTTADCARFGAVFGLDRSDVTAKVLLDQLGTLTRLLAVRSFPSAIVVSEDGHVAKFGSMTLGEAA